MTVFKRPDSQYYQYDFEYRAKRYRGSTEQLTREDAEAVEAQIKKKLRQRAWDIAPIDRLDTPSFTAFAEHVLEHKRQKLARPDVFARTLRMVLAFWGRRPTKSEPVEGAVYHDLRLLDPISDPEWIVRFENWMLLRGLSNSTKNSYRSAMAQLYELALRPQWRKITHIKENPFEHIDRDRPNRRQVDLSLDDIRRWLEHADPHVRLALAIGALAPKLRLNQVLALRFSKHFDRDLTTITFQHHKTSRFAGQPQRTAIVSDLQLILREIRRLRPEADYVIVYRRKRGVKERGVKDIKRALKSAARAANLRWGIKANGVTFHALRHSMATAIARLGGISRLLHAAVLGHKDPRTTEQVYTHLGTEDERNVLEQIAPKLAITELVMADVGTSVGSRWRRRGKNRRK